MLAAMERWHRAAGGALGQMSVAITRRRVRHGALAEWADAFASVAEEIREQVPPVPSTNKKRVRSRRGSRAC